MAPKILLSEGSSLSAREIVTVLGRAGRAVELCAPLRRCFCSYSQWVRRVHVLPATSSDPAAYLEGVRAICREGRVEVLLPSHEQAYLFAACRVRDPSWPGAATAVPIAPFSAFRRIQTKSALADTLAAAGLPHPPTRVVRSDGELAFAIAGLLEDGRECVVKMDAGTGSAHQLCVRSRAEADALAARGFGGGWPAIVQARVGGPLERTQAVFSGGRLLAAHGYRQLQPGLSGGDVVKESVLRPAVIAHLGALGAHLRWHGGLSLDYILEGGDPNRPVYLDANPRLVEPVNAYLGGVDLPGRLLDVALGRDSGALAVGRAGIRTRLGIPGLMECAVATASRAAIAREAWRQRLRRGSYAGTEEELNPGRWDAAAAVPYIGLLAMLLWNPRQARDINRMVVDSFALGPRGYAHAGALAGTGG
ncbi:MAG TPA: hypothetical protein VHC86_07010 [Opitutaceae bacterium]|nr:hypothetical protein [Opitutaceae bacterium]